MAVTIQGTGGACKLIHLTDETGFIAKLDLWSASSDFGLLQTTGFGDKGYRTFEPTICRVKGSASGMVVTSTPPVAAGAIPVSPNPFVPGSCKGEVVLTAATGCTYTFNANITGLTITRPEDGKVTVSFDFSSDGVVTQAWDVTP